MNNTGFDLKSIGDSDARGRPVSFKDPPKLGNLPIKMEANQAPTAAKLKKLNTSSVAARSDGGAKSARSAGSRTHRSQEPENPLKKKTVEEMDVMIAETTKELNQLNFKVKQVEKDQYATRTTIAAKKKPLIEQMNLLRY